MCGISSTHGSVPLGSLDLTRLNRLVDCQIPAVHQWTRGALNQGFIEGNSSLQATMEREHCSDML